MHYRTIKFVGGESSRRARARAHAYRALCGDVRIMQRFSFASGTEAS